jgi:hypothetical protein
LRIGDKLLGSYIIRQIFTLQEAEGRKAANEKIDKLKRMKFRFFTGTKRGEKTKCKILQEVKCESP